MPGEMKRYQSSGTGAKQQNLAMKMELSVTQKLKKLLQDLMVWL